MVKERQRCDSRVHGRVITLGCVTSRMSHYGPNMAQVSKEVIHHTVSELPITMDYTRSK